MKGNSNDYKRNHNNRRKGKPNDISKGGDYMKGDIKEPTATESKSEPVFNDLRWYVASERILHDAASIPYNLPVGLPFKRDAKFVVTPGSGEAIELHKYDDAIPGLMVSSVMPMLGSTSDESSAPVNVAANALFQYVRSKISGSRSYRPVDMMIYMGAMDSLYCYMTWLTRLYATVYTYHNANRYLSRAIIESQNVDYDDLVAKLPIFRAKVNIMIAKTRSLYLPSVLPIFLRHSWMFSHYFIEGDSEKDQIYYHMPAGYHYFTKDDQGAGALASVCLDDRSAGPLDVDHLLGALSSMIDPIYQDEDFNRIGGDMLKAYEGNVFTLTEIPDIATVTFAHSEEVLLQFKNAKYKYVGHNDGQDYSWKDGCFAYYQNAANDPNLHARIPVSALECYLYINGSTGKNASVYANPASTALKMMWAEWSKDTLLTSPHSTVAAGENMINTRFTLAFDMTEPPTSETNRPLIYFGSEWPVCYRLFAYHKKKADGSVSLIDLAYDRFIEVETSTPESARSLVASQMPIRSSFKYLPEITVTERNTSNTITFYESGRSHFEVDNYALISPLTVGGLHNAAILGEYNIPDLSVGK